MGEGEKRGRREEAPFGYAQGAGGEEREKGRKREG